MRVSRAFRLLTRARLFLCLHHGDVADSANDADMAGSADALPTAGTQNLSCGACAPGACPNTSHRPGAPSWVSCGRTAPFPVHPYILPPLGDDEVNKGLCWLCDTPPDFRVIADFQIPRFSSITKPFVMIAPAPAGVLHTVL